MRSEWRRKLNVKAVVPYTSKHSIHEIIVKFGSRRYYYTIMQAPVNLVWCSVSSQPRILVS